VKREHKEALTAQSAAMAIVDHFVKKQKWYYLVAEMEIEEPDHKCSPDCEHWRKHDDT